MDRPSVCLVETRECVFFVLSRFGQAWNAESGVSLWLPQFILLLQGDGFTIFAAAGVTWAAP